MRRRRLGSELRRLREAAGLTGDQVIARIGWASASKLSRLENGRSRPDLADVMDLLDLYAVGGSERDGLIAVARDAGNTRGWLRSYPVMTQRQRGWAELESGCVDIREYASSIVPGLLQTAAYARVRLQSSCALREDVLRAVASPDLRATAPLDGDGAPDQETEVAARVARQAILTRPIDPPHYEAIVEETALTARAGPPDVLREQLTHLYAMARLPNVTLRILPRDATIGQQYLPHTPFSIYRFADPDDPEMVAIEALGEDLRLEDKLNVQRHTLVFEWLRDAALTERASSDWLLRAATTFAGPVT